MKKSKTKGFTILEIVSVLAILAIFSAFLVPNLGTFGSGSELTRITSSINTIEAAVNQYFVDAHAYPPDIAASLLGKYLPNNSGTQDMIGRTTYYVNPDGTFCITANAGGQAVYSPSSRCTGQPVPEEPVINDPLAPPPAGTSLSPWVAFGPSSGFFPNGFAYRQQAMTSDGFVYRVLTNPVTGTHSLEKINLETGEVVLFATPFQNSLNKWALTTQIVDDVVYFFNDVPSFNVSAFNHKTSQWVFSGRTTSTLTEFRYAATAVLGGEIYLAGGLDYTDGILKYNPISDQWTTVATAPYDISHSNMAFYNNKMYLFGGYTPDMAGKTLVYDMSTQAWSTKASFGISGYDAGMVQVGTKLYLTSGRYETSNSLLQYDFETNQWTTQPAIPYRESSAAGGATTSLFYYNNALYSVPGSLNSPTYPDVKMTKSVFQ